MSRTEKTIWPLAAALLLLLLGCGGPETAPETVGPFEAVVAAVLEARGEGASGARPAAVRAGALGAEGTRSGSGAHGAHAGHAADSALAAATATGHSVYLLPSSWQDREGRRVSLADLSGKAQVVAMVYTHCTFACPRILAQMKALEAAVVEAGLEERVGFTLVSLDTRRDTPARLDEFARSVRLDGERWTLLTGTEDDVRALSILLGVKYRVGGEGAIDHSNLITILDPGGVPVHRLEGLDADTGPAFDALRTLVE